MSVQRNLFSECDNESSLYLVFEAIMQLGQLMQARRQQHHVTRHDTQLTLPRLSWRNNTRQILVNTK